MDGLYDAIFRFDANDLFTSRKLVTVAAVCSGIYLVTHAIVLLARRKKDATNLPPGLPSLPFIGSFLFLPKLAVAPIFFMEKAREIGPVVKIYFPNRLAVIINGRETIYNAFVKQSLPFASRPNFFSYGYLNPKRKGIMPHPYDSEFRRYHQLSLNILKNFGFGKGIMESRIHLEVEYLLADIRKLNGMAVCADQLITRSVSNVILSIMFGERYDNESPELAQLNENTHLYLCSAIDVTVVDLFPALRFIPKYRRSINASTKLHDEILKHMNSKIDAGLRGELPESFITRFVQMEGPGFDREQLLCTLQDFLLAGTETSAMTLQWALILLANHRDIQERLHREIDSVVARDRLPALDDRQRLPFAEAVLLEVLRIRTAAPFGLPHETLDDTLLNGYFIPKGTIVIPNLYSADMDPAVWQDPHNFNPERFLDEHGDVTNRDAVIPFSLGRRSCIGELLAQQELYLFLTGLVQHFEIRPPDDQPTVSYKTGISMAPIDYKIRLLARRSEKVN